MAIRVGTSGFQYDDWRGVLYPPGTARRRYLETYAAEFDVVELNYTYYSLPTPRTLGALAERTPPGFGFAVKLHRSMTHERTADDDTVRRFLEALEPLAAAGKLRALLAQFPQSLHPDRAARAHLERLRGQLAGLPLVFEFRQRAWIRDEVRRWLRALEVSYCAVDQPALPDLVPPVLWVTGPLIYLRFHGRNAERWYVHDDPAERYAWRYSGADLAGWASRLQAAQRSTGREVLAFFNNHFRGNAVHDARTLRGLLASPTGPAAPEPASEPESW